MEHPKSSFSLTGNALKGIAILAMTVDHLTWTLAPGYSRVPWVLLLHLFGRITAPIMWFFIAEGFHYTRNLKKYGLRLFILAIISHFAYNFCFGISMLPFRSGVFNQTGVVWIACLGALYSSGSHEKSQAQGPRTVASHRNLSPYHLPRRLELHCRHGCAFHRAEQGKLQAADARYDALDGGVCHRIFLLYRPGLRDLTARHLSFDPASRPLPGRAGKKPGRWASSFTSTIRCIWFCAGSCGYCCTASAPAQALQISEASGTHRQKGTRQRKHLQNRM